MKTTKLKAKKILTGCVICFICFGAGFYLGRTLMPGIGGMRRSAGDVVVSVQGLEKKDLRDKKKYIATVEAINSVNIVPQVSGYLEEVRFKDGAFVRAGETLFVIEQSKFQANVAAAEADLEKAKSDLVQVSSDLKRQKQLYAEKITPKAELEVAENKFNQAQASVKQAEANLTLAQINLGYTEIKAPISGYIGKVLVTKGNYVSPSVPSLARIVQTDPIRIAFSVSDKERLTFLKNVHETTDTCFEVVYPDGKTVEVEAENFFADNEINAETATLPVYLDYKNPDNALIPGNYVDVLMSAGVKNPSLVVPLVALAQDAQGTYALAVGDDHVVRQVYLKLGRIFGQVQEVISGLDPDDRVIVQGLQKVYPGLVVKPVLVK